MSSRYKAPDFLMDARLRLWPRLVELAEKEIMTETERIKERALSKEFWDWQPVEYRLRPDVQWLPWGAQDTHPLQRRIMCAVRINRCVQPDDLWARRLGMR